MKAFTFFIFCVLILAAILVPNKKKAQIVEIAIGKAPAAFQQFKKTVDDCEKAVDGITEWFSQKKGFSKELYFAKTWNDRLVPAVEDSCGDLITEICYQKGNFPREIVIAVIIKESSNGKKMKGDAGEIGWMQVMPETGKHYGVSPEQLWDKYHNILAGVSYLADLYEQFDHDVAKTLVAYKCGANNTVKNPEKTRYYQEANALIEVAQAAK